MTITQINKAIKHTGVKFIRGEGYYYGVAIDGSWTGEGIYACSPKNTTIKMWEDEAKAQMIKFNNIFN